MLALLPVLLLLLTSVAVFFLQRIKSGFGIAWMTSAGMSLAIWLVVLVYHWLPPAPYTNQNWLPFNEQGEALVFRWDSISWVYSFCLVSLLLAVILTASVRFKSQTRSTPSAWAGGMALTAASVLAVLSTSPLVIIITWGILDFIELGMMLAISNEFKMSGDAVLSFGARVAGILMAIWGVVVNSSTGAAPGFETVRPAAAVFFLLACGLRLGVLPLQMAFSQETSLRRGLGLILRMAIPASSLALLARLPGIVIPPGYEALFLAVATLATLYGASRWATGEDEIAARPFWLIAMAGFAIANVILGNAAASIPWGIGLILGGGMLSLFTLRNRPALVVMLIGMGLILSGIPFTPLSDGWGGFGGQPWNPLVLLFIFAQTFLLAGYFRYLVRPGSGDEEVEQWAQSVYPAGLAFLPVSAVLANYLLTGFHLAPAWWNGVMALFLALLLVAYLYRRLPVTATGVHSPSWLRLVVQRGGNVLVQFFSLGWAKRLFAWLYRLIQRLIGTLTVLLEGDGGVLWAMVLLAMMITLVFAGGGK